MELPKPVRLLALIDTGATRTVFQSGVAASLNLNPVGLSTIATPSSSGVTCPEFFVQLLFPALRAVTTDITAIEVPMQGQPVQMLIGRDVLARAVFVYNGVAGHYSLSF
jgi:predicted aspartyl protease